MRPRVRQQDAHHDVARRTSNDRWAHIEGEVLIRRGRRVFDFITDQQRTQLYPPHGGLGESHQKSRLRPRRWKQNHCVDNLQIVPVDERDSGWENEHPRFRVYFQRTQGSWVGGWTATYDITGADIVQVIDWAQRQAGQVFVYSIALVYDDRATEQSMPGHGRGLVWLVGMDGNRGDDDLDPAAADIQRRMVARRREPVIVPSADQMPPGILEPYSDANGST